MTSSTSDYKFLVFGGTGAIGKATVHAAIQRKWNVLPSSREMNAVHGISCIRVDPFAAGFDVEPLVVNGPYQAVCWAQGWNFSDNVYDVDLDQHLDLYKANCLFVIATLQILAKNHLLARAARLCVVSSIWQTIARQDKLSYSITKSALHGLVSSAATDLAADGHLFNAVLPGILDTPMTRDKSNDRSNREGGIRNQVWQIANDGGCHVTDPLPLLTGKYRDNRPVHCG